MIQEAIDYCFEDGKWLKNGLIGSLLVIASILIIPAFTLLGYLVKVMREESLPNYENLVQMTIDGFKAAIIMTIYIGIPLSIVIAAGSGTIAWAALILELLAVYGIYSPLYEFANGKMKDAFGKKALKNAFTLNYFKGFGGMIGISIIIGIAWTFSLLLVFTILLLPAVYYYQYLIGFRIMTEAIEAQKK